MNLILYIFYSLVLKYFSTVYFDKIEVQKLDNNLYNYDSFSI